MAESVQDLLKLLKKEEIVTLLINASVTDPGLEQTIRELAMEKKQKVALESSQLVEPSLKQHKSEAEQENLPVQEEKEDDQAFELSPTSPFGQTNSLFGASFISLGNWQTNALSGSSFTSFRASTSPFGQTNSLFGASCSPAFGSSMCSSSSTTAFGSSSTSFGGSSGFGQKPTSVQKHLEAVSKQMELEAIQTAEQAAFGARRLNAVGGPGSNPFTIISYPAITEEDGGTSGQTAKLESISAMPAYNYERYESCFAIAGADYCVIAADFTRGDTKISELSRKSVMASCGFQADVKALQEALSAENSRYECEHNKPMSCPEMRMLFCDIHKSHPKYVFIVLGGLDSQGKGRVFQHFGPGVATMASGVGHPGSRLPPILKYKLPAKDVLARMSEAEAVDLAKVVFKFATKTGDKLEIAVLNASGLRREIVDLRKDRP